MTRDLRNRAAASDVKDTLKDTSAADANPYGSPQADDPTKPRHPLAWIVRHVVGWTSLAIGLAGLLLPILPGWPFIIWGVFALAPDIPVFARLLDLFERKVPRLRPIIERVRGEAPRAEKADGP
ncbi:MAG TPA: hypothetical protein VGX78_06735 [Pirellulales bacterium]|nr:hypothetical protein [Pirellulales bacterium]